MGCWDEYCLFCGNSCHVMEDYVFEENEITDQKEIKEYNKASRWFENGVILTSDNKVNFGCYETDCNCAFKQKKSNNCFTTCYDGSESYLKLYKNEQWGVFIHKDCYNYVCKKYDMKIQFKHLPLDRKKYLINTPDYINYGIISKYWGQFMEYSRMKKDKNMYLIQSPLYNKKNASRVDKIVSQMKIKKDRTGPSASATFYEDKSIKLGNDNHFWIKKNNKWNRINEVLYSDIFKFNAIDFKYNKNTNSKIQKSVKYFNSIPCIGYYAKRTLMVKNYKHDGKIITLELIGTKETIEKSKEFTAESNSR